MLTTLTPTQTKMQLRDAEDARVRAEEELRVSKLAERTNKLRQLRLAALASAEPETKPAKPARKKAK